MRIPAQLRQTLVGTTVVGALFGVLCACASFAFYSEYGPHRAGASHDTWANTFRAIGIFLWVTAGIVCAFGVLPSTISLVLCRLSRKASRSSTKKTCPV